MTFDRVRVAALADYLAAAAVISLPWSTSATSILAALWAVAAALTPDRASLQRVSTLPAAALPVALVVLAVAGMLWSEADWPQRLSGMSPYLKLLAIPLLFLHFSRSGRGEMVLTAFFASACVLLTCSWLLVFFPQIPWKTLVPGVPVKDYILQSEVFVLCAFALLDRAIINWGPSRTNALLLAGVAFVFLGNVAFVALGRTAVVISIILFAVLGLRHFQRRALAAFVVAGVAVAAMVWSASPYLRFRVTHLMEELDSRVDPNDTSAGLRVGFWKMSLKIVREAPLLGHGTGSAQPMFARAAAADRTAPARATNPHNQILAIAIPLGLVGVVLLLAMWGAHFRMFLGPGSASWIGLSVVAQNFVGSLFNSHLFDFSQGWVYAFGVGIAGGMALRKRAAESKTPTDEAAAALPASAPGPGLEPAAGAVR
jgi:O-antigen ligase